MKKLVIYTCITGAYDVLSDPVSVSPDADYVCFTDSAVRRGVWQTRTPVRRERNALLTARWHKLNPHELFPDYEYSLWVDGNVIPASGGLYELLGSFMARGTLWAGICHPERDDVYEEAFRILRNGRESLPNLVRTCRFLSSRGFPRHWGLMETNVLLRRHNAPAAEAADRLWFSLLKKYTRRDQMTQTYCMRQAGLPLVYLLPKGESARNSKLFRYVVHDVPYRKDRSPGGMARDAAVRLRCMLFRIFLRFNGTPL